MTATEAIEAMDITERESWIAEQIEETAEDIAAGSILPGSYLIGGDEKAFEVVFNQAGRVTRWARA